MNTSPRLEDISFRITSSLPFWEAAELYCEAGWMERPDTEAVTVMLRNSYAVSAAFHGERLIGFMRAFSDGVSDAYMLDLIVKNEYRKLGVGRTILENLAAHLKAKGIDWILCIGAPGTGAFYGRTGATVMEGYTPYRF